MNQTPKWAIDALDLLEYHEGKIKEFGQRARGRQYRDRSSGWSLRKTAEEKKMALGKVSELIRLGKALKKNGRLVYSSKDAALKIANKIL